jgi:hypothetical protein
MRLNARWAMGLILAIPVGLSPPIARADDSSSSAGSSYAPQSVWINPGVFSQHFNQSYGYRQENWGFGAQVNLPDNLALLGGEFINSDNARSHDIGLLWQPLSAGPFKLGAVAGGFDGYPHFHNGAWFPAVLPMASVSYGIVGANFSVIPNYGNRLHGAFVMQLLLRVWHD